MQNKYISKNKIVKILKIKSRKLTLLLVTTMDKRIVMAVTNVLH